MSDSNAPLTLALPSKGRLKEQCDAWLSEAGFKLEIDGGERGYRASLRGLPGAEVRLLSAGDIASAVDAGEVHLGVTGEDLVRERPDGVDERVMLLKALGFGRADLVVAAPQSWIDVETMADIGEVAQAYLARTGNRLRVATKYAAQTRGFFARHGVADYRIVESLGATEGAPAAGAAELVVDITTTGNTLAANNLKIVGDGVMLKSQAQLAASLRATWTAVAIDRRGPRPRQGPGGPELAGGAGDSGCGGGGVVLRPRRGGAPPWPSGRCGPADRRGRGPVGVGRRPGQRHSPRLCVRPGLPGGGCVGG
jgi:ATP phosphoribosyltransferase